MAKEKALPKEVNLTVVLGGKVQELVGKPFDGKKVKDILSTDRLDHISGFVIREELSKCTLYEATAKDENGRELQLIFTNDAHVVKVGELLSMGTPAATLFLVGASKVNVRTINGYMVAWSSEVCCQIVSRATFMESYVDVYNVRHSTFREVTMETGAGGTVISSNLSESEIKIDQQCHMTNSTIHECYLTVDGIARIRNTHMKSVEVEAKGLTVNMSGDVKSFKEFSMRVPGNIEIFHPMCRMSLMGEWYNPFGITLVTGSRDGVVGYWLGKLESFKEAVFLKPEQLNNDTLFTILEELLAEYENQDLDEFTLSVVSHYADAISGRDEIITMARAANRILG
ncbi:hypothetical protein [Vibrio phage pTD1]|uniref:Uncharacterized protein n=1 Tax=Vibrio phage pTD1 TaxID=1938577 RepID=A0A1Q2U2Q2_9CAUD|nr:hypothetical protein FDH33_gp034 [Vibrio phage pTD1]BAW98243.1 hypothetical protein [Vibrio phage pTD1]